MKFYVISRTPQGSNKGHNKVAGSYQAIAWAMLLKQSSECRLLPSIIKYHNLVT